MKTLTWKCICIPMFIAALFTIAKTWKQSVSTSSVQSVQSLSHVRLFATPWIAARQASLSITNSQNSPKLTSMESVMPSSHLILCRPLFLLSPIPPSIRVFSNESTLHIRWPKYWSFSFKHHSLQRTPRADLLQNGLVGSPCSPRDSQESSPTPHFKSINSLVLSLLLSPTLKALHDYWKNHSFDYMNKPGRLQSMGSQNVEHNWATHTHLPTCCV